MHRVIAAALAAGLALSGCRSKDEILRAAEEKAQLEAEKKARAAKGIGEALAQKIAELHTTGKLEFYEKLKASIEPGLVELLQIPGLGPKKIQALKAKLGG